MGKKLLRLYLAFSILSVCYFLLPNKSPVFSFSPCENQKCDYIFYASNIDCLDTDDVLITKNGSSYIVKTNFENAKNIKAKLSGIMGETISFSGSTLTAFSYMQKIGMNIKLQEKVGDIQLFYGFVFGLEKYSLIKNEKINIQVAVSPSFITIGYPIILGDY